MRWLPRVILFVLVVSVTLLGIGAGFVVEHALSSSDRAGERLDKVLQEVRGLRDDNAALQGDVTGLKTSFDQANAEIQRLGGSTVPTPTPRTSSSTSTTTSTSPAPPPASPQPNCTVGALGIVCL